MPATHWSTVGALLKDDQRLAIVQPQVSVADEAAIHDLLDRAETRFGPSTGAAGSMTMASGRNAIGDVVPSRRAIRDRQYDRPSLSLRIRPGRPADRPGRERNSIRQ